MFYDYLILNLYFYANKIIMKKTVQVLLFIISSHLYSQEIGLRFGQFSNSNIAIDGIVNFDDSTRLHGDITFGNGIGANLLYDFKVKPLGNIAHFQYYFGAGVGTFIGDTFLLGINGEIGLEYLVKKTPITIGLDWRPQLNIITTTNLNIDSFGLNIRYRINEL